MKRVTLQQLGKAAVLLGRLPDAGPPRTWPDQLRRAAALRPAAAALRKLMRTRRA